VVPSAITCLAGCAAILTVYGTTSGSPYPGFAPFMCAACSLVLLLLWTRMNRSSSLSGNNKPVKILFQWAIIVSVALLMGFRAFSFVPTVFPQPHKKEYTASVYSIKMQRYTRRASLRCCDGAGKYFNAAAYLSPGTNVRNGDTIRFTAKAYVYEQNTESPAQLYFLHRGMSASFYLDNTPVTIVHSTGNSIKSYFREEVAGYVYTTYSPITSSIIMALYFGNRDYIHKEILHLFTYAGALHVLAASGLHVGIIACIPLLIGWVMRLNRKTTWILCMITVWTYLYCTDMPVSLIRAAVMLGIAVLHIIGNQQKNTFNILFMAATLILLLYPYEIYNPGFHLSFAATFGIILLFPLISRRLPRLPLGIHNAMAVTIAAQIFVVPLLIIHMGEYNVSSFMSNITIVPGVSLLLVTSIIQPFLIPCPLLAEAFARGIDWITAIIVHGTRILSSLGTHGPVQGNLAAIVMGYGALFLPFLPVFKKKKHLLITLLAALVISLTLMWNQQQPQRVLGASIPGKNGNNTILLSGGGKGVIFGLPDNYEDIVKMHSYFRNRCVSSVSLYIPHPDYSQVKQAGSALKKLPVHSIIIDRDFTFSFFFEKLCKMAQADGCPLQVHDLQSIPRVQSSSLPLSHISPGILSSPDHGRIVSLCRAIRQKEYSGLIIL